VEEQIKVQLLELEDLVEEETQLIQVHQEQQEQLILVQAVVEVDMMVLSEQVVQVEKELLY